MVAVAQQAGSIAGTVFDQQGAVVPGAAVTVTDNATGAVYTSKTTGEGSFTVPGLAFGTYSVTIVAAGFSKWETKSVTVITAQEASVKATLTIGASTETVSVEAAQAVVNTTSSELTTHVDRRQVLDLPSTTRNPLDFATQMAGVTSTGSATNGGSVMNGLRGSSNNLTQDGIDIRDSFIKTSGFANNSGYDVNLESLGEFSISGQNLEADSGAGVVQVRMVTARGTNQPHGTLFYFGRNDHFDANTWTNNQSGTPRTTLHQHRFGGSTSRKSITERTAPSSSSNTPRSARTSAMSTATRSTPIPRARESFSTRIPEALSTRWICWLAVPASSGSTHLPRVSWVRCLCRRRAMV